jgi:hypothetical protein
LDIIEYKIIFLSIWKRGMKKSHQKSEAKMSAPAFEFVADHEFRLKEKVLVIDPNGFDLWEGVIQEIEDNTYTVTYPEYPDERDAFTDLSRVLVATKTNLRIFKEQEMIRSQILPPISDGEEPDLGKDSNDDIGGDHGPAHSSPKRRVKKSKKPTKKESNQKKRNAPPRPPAARTNPPRRTHKN